MEELIRSVFYILAKATLKTFLRQLFDDTGIMVKNCGSYQLEPFTAKQFWYELDTDIAWHASHG